MTWNSEIPEEFPAAVQRAVLPGGTAVVDRYVIREVLYVSGMECFYRAQDQATEEEVVLCEMLPMQWCMQDENGYFMPFHNGSGGQWDNIRESILSKLRTLQSVQEPDAPSAVLDVMEDRGTVFYTIGYRSSRPLQSLLAEKLLSPKQAIKLLAPVLDVLAGLHAAGMCHGAITASAIRLIGEQTELRDWCSGMAFADASGDVQAVSRLLYQMMTGETEYRRLTAASLPKPVRNALYNGMYDPTMDISRLWQELHAKKAPRRVKYKVAKTYQPTPLAKVLSPAVTLGFCLLCVGVPLVMWGIHAGTQEKEQVKENVAKFPDIPYLRDENAILMPELLGMTQDDAIEMLEGMGMQVILARREANPVIPENSVVTQKPDPGVIIQEGTAVTLSVSSGWANYVPDVTSMVAEQAQERLEALGFVVETEEVPSPGDAPGTVVAQSIEPETKLERDKTVTLKISIGRSDLDKSRMETVGDYVGMDFGKAKKSLAELNLYAMQSEMVYDASTPAGTILEQDVPSDKKVPQGTIINMKVSKGVETTRVPSVVRMNAASAKATLEAAGLICVLCYVSNGEYAMDVVLSQNVAVGKLIPTKSEVWLNVSIGSASNVGSTGGWTGGDIPTFGSPTEPPKPAEADPPREEEAPQPQQTTPPAAPAATEAPAAPPAPVTPPAPGGNSDNGLAPPPMPQ